MRKKDGIVHYTAEQLAEMRARGETRSNWAKAAKLTNEEIEAQIAAGSRRGQHGDRLGERLPQAAAAQG